MKFFDSHAHLDDEKFNDDREEIIKKCIDENNCKFVTIGYSLDSSRKALNLAEEYDLYATIGISPNDIPQTKEQLWKDLIEMEHLVKTQIESNPKLLVAIGEIGLDYYWNRDNKELQKEAFIKQIEIANKYDLPITIHTRDAVDDTLEILKFYEAKNAGIFHCCPHNRELVKQGLKLGFYISFAGPVTFKNAKNADEIIKMVPNDKMLIETDSPYLSPEPNRGKRNDPRNVKFIAQKIADVKNLTLAEVARLTFKNAKTVYRIKK